MKNKIVILISLLIFTGCKSQPVTSTQPAGKTADANLTRTEAEARAKAIHNVKYQLAVGLDDKDENFSGDIHITFDAAAPFSDLFLDFKNGAKINFMSINGRELAPAFANHRLALPEIKAGANEVVIRYKQTYARDGRGLHRFQDPEDKRIYLHTQFEAFDAHQMFPCFDQPDMKATMTMTVTAPKAWQVITTTRESAKVANGETMNWTFPESPPISTYLFSLHAGPYFKWESHAGKIPLRLFARQSIKKYVVTKEWWGPTQAGLKFYGDYFSYPYPFVKYDQIIAPEMGGAMENVAAITFTERFIHRSPSTYKEREILASVILHEMAHMWFGDLVTMQWWNGLWLNESFATYMSTLAMTQATEFKNSWLSFYSRNKTGAYVEDQLVTTHPIDAVIPDTVSAFSNFDSITYGKGASVLKQLSYYIGEKAFREGVRDYFIKHAFSNTRLDDFIAALEQTSHKDLQQWAKTWLESAGVDTVQLDYTCSDGKVSRFALRLDGPNGLPSPRAHRTLVRLYKVAQDKIMPQSEADVEYSGPRTEVPQLVGAQCPDLAYPNDQDQDYVKVRLDDRTLATAKTSLSKIPSEFTRMMFWPNLYSMVRDMALTPQDYLRIVRENLPKEEDLTIADAIVAFLPTVIFYLPQATPEDKQLRADLVQGIENLLWSKIQTAHTDWQKMLLRSFTQIVESKPGRDHLIGLLNGTTKVKGLTLDPDRRWEIIIRLSGLGDPRVDPLLAKQKTTDKSDRGVENAFAAEAAKPSLAVKNEWLHRALEAKDLSIQQKAAILYNLLPRIQDDLRAALSADYYKSLPQMIGSRELNFLSMYSGAMIPTTCTPDSAAKIAEFTKNEVAALPAPVLKILRIGGQEDGRCVSIRAHSAAIQRVN